MSTEQLTSNPLGGPEEDKVIAELDSADESLEVEVRDDRPEGDRVASRDPSSGNDEDLRGVTKSVQKRINKLKYDYHEERRSKESAERMREEAVRFAQTTANENKQLRDLVNRGEKVLIEEVQARAQTDVDAAKGRVKKALEEGESDEIVEAQEAFTKASYEAQRSAEYKPVSQVQPAQPAQPAPRPPVRKPDPKASDWQAENAWFGTDREMSSHAMVVHDIIVKEEHLDPQSDEYYARIDEKMRERFPEKFEGSEGSSRSDLRSDGPSPRPTTVVAAARRNNGAHSMKVQLTRTQVALAKRLGITPEAYAKQVLELERSNG
tara:strand:- start:1490 stop:2455 length:966 start_codon:yes stop_codon:yes gene_type:complete